MIRLFLAVAIAALVTAFGFMLPRSADAAPSPLIVAEPAPPAIERCITPKIVQHDIDAMLISMGNPPTIVGVFPLADGMIVTFWVVGSPAAMSYEFREGCLVGQFLSPPPS